MLLKRSRLCFYYLANISSLSGRLHQPPMLTLKQFLLDQDDNIDEETLLKKYNDYKSDFRRTQLQEFFNRHKDEEW